MKNDEFSLCDPQIVSCMFVNTHVTQGLTPSAYVVFFKERKITKHAHRHIVFIYICTYNA